MRLVDGKTLQATIQFLHSSTPKAKTASFFESHETQARLAESYRVMSDALGDVARQEDYSHQALELYPFS